jgi:ABC-type transport system involved in multi-copper enzyme maturation permease subunit
LSVYKHEYRAYAGRLTSPLARIGVLTRYAYAEAWSSRITTALFVAALLPIVVYLVGIYLANNPMVRAVIAHGKDSFISVDASFFLRVVSSQCWLAVVLTAWVAPRLVSFDISDNALPILLSHPISRFGYVAGKFTALFSFLSLITWIPCIGLFAYQAYSSPAPWAGSHLRIGMGLLAGSLLWIVVLSLLGLALSSWVKWRVVATGVIFAAIFVPAGIGSIVSAILRTRWGFIMNVPVIMTQLWQRMLGAPEIMSDLALPTGAIAAVLLLLCALSVAMLNARIRAREVVRG